jgi:hypothetical protein
MRTRASSGSLFSSASQVDCLTHVASCRLKCGSHLCLSSSSKHNTSAGIAFCSYSRALTNLIVSSFTRLYCSAKRLPGPGKCSASVREPPISLSSRTRPLLFGKVNLLMLMES